MTSSKILKLLIYLRELSEGRGREHTKDLNISRPNNHQEFHKGLELEFFSNLSIIHFGGVKESLTRLLKSHVHGLPEVFDLY